MLDSFPLSTVITAVGTILSGAIGALLTYLYNKRKMLFDAAQLQLVTRQDAAKLEVDDSIQLRRDLLEERKTLLGQLLAERQFFTERITAIEAGYNDKVRDLEKRVSGLEQANYEKDQTILAQQKKIDGQELQIMSQKQLIEVLQGEVKGLKNGNTSQA